MTGNTAHSPLLFPAIRPSVGTGTAPELHATLFTVSFHCRRMVAEAFIIPQVQRTAGMADGGCEMADEQFEVPLFPLNVVLFPGMALPLHIFESRYRDMTADCLADQAPFGVLLALEDAKHTNDVVPA